jgi:demethylmenaquinone methyltransferase/2-methoxy-6-polyprenyl-1,4-benzoquinol methylase
MSSRHGPGDVQFFDRFARLFDVAMLPPRVGPIRDGLRFARRPVERILDVGGGTGRVARALSRVGPEPIVVDPSAGMLARARRGGRRAIRADARSLPLCDRTVDAVVVVDALHHVPDPERALEEAARVVAPGGVVVLREFDPRTVRGRGVVAAERAIGFDSAFWTPAESCARFERVGLDARIVREGFEYVVVGRRPTD